MRKKGEIKMYIFDLTNIITLVLLLIATILLTYLSQEIKNSKVALVTLIAFVIDLVIHTIQIISLKDEYSYLYSTLCWNMAIDYVFLLITYLAYIWADEIESKKSNKKTLNDKGIKWLFKKI